MAQAATRRQLSTNERMVVDLLLERGPLDRPALAKATGLSRPAAGDLVGRLLEAGYLVEAGERETVRRGPNAMTYAAATDLAYVAGVEMQPTHVRVAVADLSGLPLADVDLPHQDSCSAVELVTRAVRKAAAEAGIDPAGLSEIVIGTPGVIGPDGDVDFVSGHPDWVRGQRARLGEALGCPVRLENDVNLAAVAEHRLGAGRGVRSFVLLRCDEGLGAAVVLGGTLVRGAHGYAGELGYAPVATRPGSAGTPEDGYQSLVGRAELVRVLRALGVEDLSPEEMLGDPLLRADVNRSFLQEVARRYALISLTICAVIDPERLLLSGALAQAGGTRLAQAITEHIHATSPMRPEVTPAVLDEHAVVTGALVTVLDTVRDDVYGVGPVHDPAPRPTPSDPLG